MLKKIRDNISFTENQKEEIKSIGVLDKESWDSSSTSIKELKEFLKDKLEESQKSGFMQELNFVECAYCGLFVNDTGRGEIEHIALKSKYPEFSFFGKNLLIVCSHCNGSSKKGKKEKGYIERINNYNIDVNSDKYFEQIEEAFKNIKFEFINPKIDNPDEEIKWKDEDKVLLDIENSTEKGKKHIRLFFLDDQYMTFARQRKVTQEKDYKRNPSVFEEMQKYITKN